ncbi:class I SAM-dependent methyltransferase [Pseudonocardia lacus]|uniref:class I SAM-dependent methyltransferase n=1 Tax=Pseudonocardia lacus TaxID=2835865 RepID=UPI001BDBBA22|nr:class I SAM-dependent methyltransferase [Pseudonocardia lacus]
MSAPATPASPAPSWSTGTTPNRFAALPAGRLGRLGGRLMRLLNRGQQREVLALLAASGVDAAVEVVEIGPGPGVLLGLLAARADVRRVVGVEPSVDMRALAIRANAAAIAADRLEVRPGDAATTGLPDGCADVVVSVNTVAIWPDLDSGAGELRRLLRPGGRLLLSWHGGRAPSRAARPLLLDEAALGRIETALRRRFDTVERTLTRHCTVFDAGVAPTTRLDPDPPGR